MKQNLKQAAAVPIVTVIALVVSLFHQTRQSNKIAKRESYQKLELASINLFQFELENSEKTWRLYNNGYDIAIKEDDEETREIREMMNHVTQILNLFEMSIELHKMNVFDNKIFSTWMKWIHEIAQLNNFQTLWNEGELSQHYTGELFCLIKIAKGKEFEDFVELLCYKEKFEGIKLFFNRRKGKSCHKHECCYDCYKKLYRYRKLGEYLQRYYVDKQYEYNHFKRVFAKLVKRFKIKNQNKITRCFYEKD